MFFIAGAYNKQEQLDFHQSMVCPHCGQYGQYQAYIQYMVFSFLHPYIQMEQNIL